MTDSFDVPLRRRYPDGEQPDVGPTDNPAFDPETHWVNYWDMNPIEHGGKFIKWTGDMWKVVEVTPPSAWPEPEHIIDVQWFEPHDVWEDPSDPLTDFTDDMKSILRSLSDEHHLPAEPPFLEQVTYYVADLTHYMRTGGRSETVEIGDDVEAYWSALEGYGVDPADVEGVADSDLPEAVRETDE